MSSVAIKFKSLKQKKKAFEKQVTFAAFNAQRRAAFVVREAVNVSITDTFTTRGKHATKGTRVKKPTKRNLTAWVGTTRDYLEDHVTGATRRGKNAVPTKNIRRNFARRIRRSRWPGQLRDSRFFARRKGSMVTVFRRGRGRRRRLKPLWFVVEAQKVIKRWEFEHAVVDSYQPALTKFFPGEVKRAFATAK